MRGAVFVTVAAAASLASCVDLPAARAPDRLPPGPGVELATAYCGGCHSLDYLLTQPRGRGERFWRDSVTKMRAVYGAEMSDEDAATITGYLARSFGEPQGSTPGP